jgi:hypothetical protein
MNFDLHRMLESKRALRRRLAAQPVVEKLRLLDELRARLLAIRGASSVTREPLIVAEPPAKYDSLAER